MFVVALVVILAALVSLSVGRYTISPFDTITILCAPIFNTIPTWTHQAQIVVCSSARAACFGCVACRCSFGFIRCNLSRHFPQPACISRFVGGICGRLRWRSSCNFATLVFIWCTSSCVFGRFTYCCACYLYSSYFYE